MVVNQIQTIGPVPVTGLVEAEILAEESRPQASRNGTVSGSRSKDLPRRSGASSETVEDQENAAAGPRAKTVRDNLDVIEERIKDMLENPGVAFRFTLDTETKEIILQVVDPDTNEVVQKIPSDLALKITRMLASTMEQGQIADAKV